MIQSLSRHKNSTLLRGVVHLYLHLTRNLVCDPQAEWEKRDPRWIVENRADGTNCNHWHWYTAKKNCFPGSFAYPHCLMGVSILMMHPFL